MTIATAAARLTTLEAAGQDNTPFFAHENLAAGAGVTLGGTATLTDGDALNAVQPGTAEFWLPDVTTTTAVLEAELPAARSISCAALCAHNLADLGASARLQRSTDGVSWSDAGAGLVTPTDNRPIVWRMATSGNDAVWWRVFVSGLTSGDALAIGVFFLGDDLVLPNRVFRQMTPVLTPTEVQLQSNVSQGGNPLGSSVLVEGSTLQTVFANLPDAFVRGAGWLAFQAAFNRGRPAFFGWRPDDYPDDVHYVWRGGGALRPAWSAAGRLWDVQFAARVYEG